MSGRTGVARPRAVIRPASKGAARAFVAGTLGKIASADVVAGRRPRVAAASSTSRPNALYYGDNLEVLRRHVRDESIDLVYLDPPFNSNANYNVLFEDHGEKAAAQVRAFEDTWEWNADSRAAYEELVEGGGRVAETMRAFHTMLGGTNMLAYLSMMAPRLIELQRVLKASGSLYLHCDPTASHYLKLLLDAVLGAKNLRNEIVWWYRKWSRAEHQFLRNHDVLLFYSKSSENRFNILRVPLAPSTLRRFGGKRQDFADDARTRKVTTDEESAGGFRPDVWAISLLPAQANERLGYPTQKPLALLRLVIEASSSPGDVVLDPFAGCGTTIDAAQELGRRWVGIDITHLSIGLIKHRLIDRHGPNVAETYRTIGEPTTADDARVLAREDPFQFQAWALGLVGARVAGSAKKGGDKGIDGRLYFHEGTSETRQVVFSVKAGHLVPNFVRDLRGVIEREKAEMGVLLSFEQPSAGMRAEAAEAGFYESPWGRHPRIQLRTIAELLDGKSIDYPHVTGSNVTRKRAQRVQSVEAAGLQPTLGLDLDSAQKAPPRAVVRRQRQRVPEAKTPLVAALPSTAPSASDEKIEKPVRRALPSAAEAKRA